MRVDWVLSAVIVMFLSGLSGCGGGHAPAVESGAYQGSIQEVNAGEREIYVKTEDGQVLELYFTDQTTLQRNGDSVEFSALANGQEVMVEVEAKEDGLTPLSVTIMTQNTDQS